MRVSLVLSVIPAKAGIHACERTVQVANCFKTPVMGPRLRGDDEQKG